MRLTNTSWWRLLTNWQTNESRPWKGEGLNLHFWNCQWRGSEGVGRSTLRATKEEVTLARIL